MPILRVIRYSGQYKIVTGYFATYHGIAKGTTILPR